MATCIGNMGKKMMLCGVSLAAVILVGRTGVVLANHTTSQGAVRRVAPLPAPAAASVKNVSSYRSTTLRSTNTSLVKKSSATTTVKSATTKKLDSKKLAKLDASKLTTGLKGQGDSQKGKQRRRKDGQDTGDSSNDPGPITPRSLGTTPIVKNITGNLQASSAARNALLGQLGKGSMSVRKFPAAALAASAARRADLMKIYFGQGNGSQGSGGMGSGGMGGGGTGAGGAGGQGGMGGQAGQNGWGHHWHHWHPFHGWYPGYDWSADGDFAVTVNYVPSDMGGPVAGDSGDASPVPAVTVTAGEAEDASNPPPPDASVAADAAPAADAAADGKNAAPEAEAE